MDNKDVIPSLAAIITACGGAIGILTAAVAFLNGRRQSRRQSIEEEASLRTVTDRASASVIQMLRTQHKECQERLDGLERRLDVFERTMPVLQMRDQIMREHISATGELPRMPAVNWDALERAGQPQQRQPPDTGVAG